MVDVELLLSDNGGVRIYPTEWQLIFPTESSNVIYVREFTNTRWVLGGTSIPALKR